MYSIRQQTLAECQYGRSANAELYSIYKLVAVLSRMRRPCSSLVDAKEKGLTKSFVVPSFNVECLSLTFIPDWIDPFVTTRSCRCLNITPNTESSPYRTRGSPDRSSRQETIKVSTPKERKQFLGILDKLAVAQFNDGKEVMKDQVLCSGCICRFRSKRSEAANNILALKVRLDPR